MSHNLGEYWLYTSYDLPMSEQVKSPFLQNWLILNDMDYDLFPTSDKQLGYLLKKGDVIKFGRVRFMVTQISG